MADYHSVSTWRLRAPIEKVWAAIRDLERLPTWYPAVQQVQALAAGDPDRVGSRVRYLIRGRLPLRLVFEATTTEMAAPRELELATEGDLGGTARWDLEQQGEVTSVRYTWDVRTTKAWMNLGAPLARPLFSWNSRGGMLQAGEGLARFLQVPLVDAEFSAAPWRVARPLRWAALASVAGLLVWWGWSSRQDA